MRSATAACMLPVCFISSIYIFRSLAIERIHNIDKLQTTMTTTTDRDRELCVGRFVLWCGVRGFSIKQLFSFRFQLIAVCIYIPNVKSYVRALAQLFSLLSRSFFSPNKTHSAKRTDSLEIISFLRNKFIMYIETVLLPSLFHG